MIPVVVRKLSIALDEPIAAAAAAAAERAGLSLSAWISAALAETLAIDAGLAAVAAYEAEFGAFTPEEIAAADEVVERMLRQPPADPPDFLR
jgi:hypothetical protein